MTISSAYRRSSQWLRAHDRRKVAIHEAGHMVVAARLRLPAEGRIREDRSHPLIEMTTWSGHMRFAFEDRQWLPPQHRAMVAVAGMVAEDVWENRDNPELLESWWWEEKLAEPDCMSDTDWRGTGWDHLRETAGDFRPLVPACRRVVKLINARSGPLWPKLCRTAHQLIVAARTGVAPAPEYVSNNGAVKRPSIRRDSTQRRNSGPGVRLRKGSEGG